MLVFPTGDGASGGEGKGKKEKDGGTALFKSIAESLCWRQIFGTIPQNWPQNDWNWGLESSYGKNKSPLPNPLFPCESQARAVVLYGLSAFSGYGEIHNNITGNMSESLPRGTLIVLAWHTCRKVAHKLIQPTNPPPFFVTRNVWAFFWKKNDIWPQSFEIPSLIDVAFESSVYIEDW